VVAHDAKNGNPRVGQPLDGSLEWADRLEARVGALDHVAGKQHRVDGKLERASHGCVERRLGRQLTRVDSPLAQLLGQAPRPRAEVHVTDRKQAGASPLRVPIRQSTSLRQRRPPRPALAASSRPSGPLIGP
jgi:hypothetical protein